MGGGARQGVKPMSGGSQIHRKQGFSTFLDDFSCFPTGPKVVLKTPKLVPDCIPQEPTPAPPSPLFSPATHPCPYFPFPRTSHAPPLPPPAPKRQEQSWAKRGFYVCPGFGVTFHGGTRLVDWRLAQPPLLKNHMDYILAQYVIYHGFRIVKYNFALYIMFLILPCDHCSTIITNITLQ